MKRVIKFIMRLLAFLLLVLAGIFGYYKTQELLVVNRIAVQFQVTPSWEAIQAHLFEEFRPGMTREEVYKILDKVGPWEIFWYDDPDEERGIKDPDTGQFVFREYIRFSERPTFHNLSAWIFTYDKDGRLVDQHQVSY